MKKMINNQSGLTLIELLAVIVILGIIAAITVPTVGYLIQKSRINTVKADAIQMINAAKLAVAEKGVPKHDANDATSPATDNQFSVISGNQNSVNELSDYVNVPQNFTRCIVNVSTDGKTFTITATAITSGITVTFSNATIDDISNYQLTSLTNTISIPR